MTEPDAVKDIKLGVTQQTASAVDDLQSASP